MNRALDATAAGLGLAVASPFLAAAALAIKLDDGGPVLYRQRRVGLDGEEFELVKLRTMEVGAERKGAGFAVNEGDSRITRAGRMLRRLSLDELPQLWNVVRGDMSLVGPRPTLAYQVERYTPRQRRRLEVRPGITGWAQIHGRARLPWEDRIELDVWYVEHRSPWLDLKIIARTPRALFARDVQGRDGRLVGLIPFFNGENVRAAVSPERALDAVRDAFVAYARGEWTMPSKVYVPAYPEGDFRAMPALGAGHALLKWVTSFPGNPAQGLPTVTGLVLLSDASNGMLKGVLDAGAVTSLRTGAAAVLAAEALGRPDAETAAVIGAGVNGEAAARTFIARGRRVELWDTDRIRAEEVAERIGAEVAAGREEALAADLLVTVTPGRQVVLDEGSLLRGQHASLMGADGPGKAEIAVSELERVRVFCDDWEQASHNGDLVHAVEAGALARDDVSQLGDVLIGTAEGRKSDDEITVFDSTGLAIQDLAIALAALERADELALPTIPL